MRKHYSSNPRKFSRKAFSHEGSGMKVNVHVDTVAAALRYNRRKGVLLGMLPLMALLSVYLKAEARENLRKAVKEAWEQASR